MMAAITSLMCPSCGAPLTLDEGDLISECKHCGTSSYLAEEGDYPRLMVRNCVGAQSARELCQEWWGGLNKARDIAKVAVIGDVRLVYLPFWSVTGSIFAWFTGYKKTKNARHPKEAIVSEGMRWNGLACSAGDLGVESLPSLEGELEPFDASKLEPYAIPYAVTESLDEAMSSATSAMVARVRSELPMDGIYQQETHLVPRQAGVVYYPVWIVDYTYKGRQYKVLLDGFLGKVVFGRAPGSALYRSAVFTGAAALGTFLIPLGFKALESCTGRKCGGSLGISLLGLAICLGGYFAFRMMSTVQGGKAIGATGIEKVVL